jgi:hypothetical protein
LAGPPGRVQDSTAEIHQLEDVGGDVGADVAGNIAVAKYRIELNAWRSMTSLSWPASQPVGEPFQHSVAERARIRVRIDSQNLHSQHSLGRPSAVSAALARSLPMPISMG